MSTTDDNSPPPPAVTRARAEADAQIARERLTGTVHELQERLDPRTFARGAARDAQEAGTVAARVGTDTVKRNPGAFAGAIAFAGLFLARHRIAALFRRKPRKRAQKAAFPALLPPEALSGSQTAPVTANRFTRID